MRALLAAVVVLAMLTSAPASAGSRPLIVGDSVTLAAAPQLRAAGWSVQARKNRTMTLGLRILRARRTLPRTVAVALGTNANVSKRDVARALQLVGPARRLVLVTPREVPGESAHDARVMRVMARRHPLRIVLVDWARRSQGHPSWLAGDLIHLTAEGAREFARLLGPVARDARSIP
jgi:hypothetical protein